MGKLLIWFVFAYKKLISPFLPPSCRFYPTCSDYAGGAIEAHGAVKGTALALWRLLRCHPFHPGGFDPVPTGRDTIKQREQTKQNGY
ncbi:MAG: membrane protein insertion efficiency factor YidD [Deltaproteobacteria bacterium]|nr:membrane protein insertion efficiency factor YidD [Deltaproteobacteria bacterium]